MRYFGFACVCLIGLVFGTSVIGKLRGRKAWVEFVTATRQMLAASGPVGSTPASWARWISVGVVGGEAAVPVLLILPSLRPIGLVLAMALLVIFAYAITATLRRGVSTSCRCFGTSSMPVGVPHLVRNVLLLTAAVGGLVAPLSGGANPSGLAIAAGVALVLALLVARLDDVADLFTPSRLTR